VWQQHTLRQRYKARSLIGGRQAACERGTRSVAAVGDRTHAGGRLHQSTGFIGRLADTNCKLYSDVRLGGKRGTVIRENLTRSATYNPVGGGFHQLAENWMAGPDKRPSLLYMHG